MSSVPQPRFYTEQEYLALERKALVKSEYFQGEIFAMAGASRKHNLITTNLVRLIGNHLADRDCEVYASDMRVRITKTGLFTYPDVTVVCDEPEFLDEELDTLLNPLLLVEVVSHSNEDHDRGFKTKHYRRLDSLQEFLLVEQTEPVIDHYVRARDGTWNISTVSGLSSTLLLTTLDLRLKLSEVFAKVKFPPGRARQTKKSK